MRIVVWQYMHVMHQSASLRALAEMGHEVFSVAEVEITEQQRSLGYFVPKFGSLKVITDPDEQMISNLVNEKMDDSVHLLGGMRGYNLGWKVLDECKKARARLGWLVEGGDPRGLNGAVRRLIYLSDAIRFRQTVNFILAMGMNGVHWYRTCGWPANRVFPYAYITEVPESSEPERDEKSPTQVEIVYVGQLIHRKGVDLLIRALDLLRDKEWHLTLVGDGAQRDEYLLLANSLGIKDRISFLGVQPNHAALRCIKKSDFVVIPSRFDGWGAVANEALMCGVPVVCSSNCGSSDLVQENWRGTIFRSKSLGNLRSALNNWISLGKRKSELSHKIRQWSHNIEGKAAANYIYSVINHVYQDRDHPLPPWYPNKSLE